MYLVSRAQASFGANDVFACTQCHGQMLLTRRSPHPDRGGFEEQRFTCTSCGRNVMRVVDENGKPPPTGAIS